MAKSNPVPIFLLSLVVFAGLGAWLHWRLDPMLDSHRESLNRISARLDRIEDSVELLHFGRDPEGWPVEAVLGYLETWANREQQYGNSLLEQPVLEERIGRGLAALRALGRPAYAAVEKRYLELGKDAERLPYRKRLLEVLTDLDPNKTRDFLIAQMTDVGAPSQLRTKAGSLLLRVDPDIAGAKLRQILLTENYRGARHAAPGSGGATIAGYPGFSNLVNLYLRSRDAGKSDTLLVLLRTKGHDIATYQAAVDGLIEAKDPESVETIKALFDNTTASEKTNEQRNALLRRKLARAVVEIEGRVACPWLQAQFANEGDGAVQSFLSQLLKQWCG